MASLYISYYSHVLYIQQDICVYPEMLDHAAQWRLQEDGSVECDLEEGTYPLQ